ncbi:hypothetical protein HJFPF1_06870 [Paramyrothecium foliicola]|nr:hypothetical protein HJFPF1_06870 [Paramyrothecium foliicola]
MENVADESMSGEQGDAFLDNQAWEARNNSPVTPLLSSIGCTLSPAVFGIPTVESGVLPRALNAATPALFPTAPDVAADTIPTHRPAIGDRQVWRFNANTTLRKRQSIAMLACGAGNIMIGQIELYPRMLTQGLALPPFIHSRCFQDEGDSFDCYEKRFHHCLPENLSICASLVHLFYAKTAANKAFVWKTIYAEQARIAREIPNYDDSTLLEALQTMCIYVILQAQDHESLERNDPKSMVATLTDISRRLHEKCGYGERNDTFERPLPRREWLFQESLRRLLGVGRTFCLLLLIEILLDVLIGRGEGPCTGRYAIPLPCGRDLWEIESTPEWSRQHKESLRRRKLSRPLTVGDIFSMDGESSSRSDANGTTEREAMLTDAASWCQGVDQYGLLFWTIITMKRA